MVMKKSTRGRQKVEMVKMSNESSIQVTFSKRRSGLFKKASELCTLCGVDIAIIVFSPGKKVFSFGHPSIEPIVRRFFTRNSLPQVDSIGTLRFIEAHRKTNICELNEQLTQVLSQLEVEKKRSEELDRIMKSSRVECWWETPIEQMDMAQLRQLKGSLEELKKNVAKQKDMILIQQTMSHDPQLFAWNSSQGVFYDHNLGYGQGF